MGYIVLDGETGEILESARVLTAEQQQIIKSKKERKEELYFTKKLTEIEYGNFFWMFYNINQRIFPMLSNSTITRLIYLATYINYDTEKISYDNGKTINEDNILDLLRISRAQYFRFKKEITESGIVSLKDGEFYLNTSIFKKGKLTFNYEGDETAVKMYINSIREIYETADVESHQSLYYFYNLIPYINREWNIVCTNPFETDKSKIDFITLGEFADIINFDRKSIKRLKKLLWSMRFNEGRSLMVNFIAHPDDDKWKIFVNPRIFCASSDIEKISILGEFCEVPEVSEKKETKKVPSKKKSPKKAPSKKKSWKKKKTM